MTRSGCNPALKEETVMSNSTQTLSVPPEAGALCPVTENPAIARCRDAYVRAYQAAKNKGKGNVFAELDAEKAYRKALPPLSGHQNICDFIACIAHGMLIGTIDGADGARLLYAAQVAHTTIRSQPASPKSVALEV
jgi:hypothetical protein